MKGGLVLYNVGNMGFFAFTAIWFILTRAIRATIVSPNLYISVSRLMHITRRAKHACQNRMLI